MRRRDVAHVDEAEAERRVERVCFSWVFVCAESFRRAVGGRGRARTLKAQPKKNSQNMPPSSLAISATLSLSTRAESGGPCTNAGLTTTSDHLFLFQGFRVVNGLLFVVKARPVCCSTHTRTRMHTHTNATTHLLCARAISQARFSATVLEYSYANSFSLAVSFHFEVCVVCFVCEIKAAQSRVVISSSAQQKDTPPCLLTSSSVSARPSAGGYDASAATDEVSTTRATVGDFETASVCCLLVLLRLFWSWWV